MWQYGIIDCFKAGSNVITSWKSTERLSTLVTCSTSIWFSSALQSVCMQRNGKGRPELMSVWSKSKRLLPTIFGLTGRISEQHLKAQFFLRIWVNAIGSHGEAQILPSFTALPGLTLGGFQSFTAAKFWLKCISKFQV